MNTEEILTDTAHRPWPLPDAPWAMRQSWNDLLFAHWRVDAAALRHSVPPPLELETFGGSAWVGVVPFEIRNLGVRNLPGLPTATDFLELNERTYVRYNGKRGVYFFTLDASSIIASTAARIGFALPYHHAQMDMRREGEWIRYNSVRDGRSATRNLGFDGSYRASGPVFTPQPGTLEHFLTERYALFTVAGSVVTRVDIHHAPWALQTAECALNNVSIIQTAGIAIPSGAPLCHFAAAQHVINWAPVPA